MQTQIEGWGGKEPRPDRARVHRYSETHTLTVDVALNYCIIRSQGRAAHNSEQGILLFRTSCLEFNLACLLSLSPYECIHEQ